MKTTTKFALACGPTLAALGLMSVTNPGWLDEANWAVYVGATAFAGLVSFAAARILAPA